MDENVVVTLAFERKDDVLIFDIALDLIRLPIPVKSPGDSGIKSPMDSVLMSPTIPE